MGRISCYLSDSGKELLAKDSMELSIVVSGIYNFMCADHDLYFFDLRELVTQFIFLSVSMAADIVKTVKEKSTSITFNHVSQFYVAVKKE